jgi:hypothetical protein
MQRRVRSAFHLPKVAALAIGMDADFALPLVVAVCGGIVESVPISKAR